MGFFAQVALRGTLYLLIGLAAVPLRGRTEIAAPPSARARAFTDAVAAARLRQLADDSVVAPGDRSILLTHGHRTRRVFVLLHGFTDSPRQFAALGERLYADGGNVYIPRLPHHAERRGAVSELARVTSGELSAFGDSAVDVAVGLGDSVIVVGLSAGATIGAAVAQHRDDVARAVLVAPAIAPGVVPARMATPLVRVAARLPNVRRTARPDSSVVDFEQGITTHGLAQVFRLGEGVSGDAGREAPRAHDIVLLLNENDRTVSGGAGLGLARRWSDHGGRVVVYELPKALALPHNVLAPPALGGDAALVNRVLESLATGAPPPDDAVRYRFLTPLPGVGE
ncbi:MAG TPA: alpha/beta hydrolase [Gemmatimonadaceae bacterium]|nr:alpha/beta hydrolase [Gemmatimonadaceae bacterium]